MLIKFSFCEVWFTWCTEICESAIGAIVKAFILAKTVSRVLH